MIPGNICTAHLDLEPFHCEDVKEEYRAWLSDWETVRLTAAKLNPSLNSLRDYVARNNADTNAYLWRIVADTHGAAAHVGNIRLSGLKHDHAELAILLGRPYWGRGIARRAIDAAATSVLSGDAHRTIARTPLRKLYAGILTANIASRKAFEHSGFTVVATLRDHAKVDGRFTDQWLMERFRLDED